jgi:hypothetical protein
MKPLAFDVISSIAMMLGIPGSDCRRDAKDSRSEAFDGKHLLANGGTVFRRVIFSATRIPMAGVCGFRYVFADSRWKSAFGLL